MNGKPATLLIFTACLVVLTACSSTPIRIGDAVSGSEKIDRLFVYSDGSMKFNERFVNADDVIIYPDGYGGERAALKMVVPLHPDFYRDSIHVIRKEDEPGR